MRAVVTGGAGFIGGHLADRLEADGWDVLVIDRATGPSIQDYRGVPQAEAIFHLASPVGPLGVLEWAGRLVPEVIESTRIVADWARWLGCPLVYVSTSELYGPQEGACSEALPRITPAGHSARMEYAVAKLAAETMLLNERSLDVRIVRPFNVAGPRQKPDGGFVMPRFARQALTGAPLTVYMPGTQLRALTHVADIVEGLLAVYERGRRGEVYNLGNAGNLCSVWDLALEVAMAVGGPSAPVLVDPTLRWPDFTEAADKWPDAAKATRELGWHPYRDRPSIIGDVVASLREPVAA